MSRHDTKLAAGAAFLLGLPALAAAQTFTSPSGYDSVEGAGRHAHVLASTTALSWQQIDSTTRSASARTLTSIAWRRDGTTATNAAFAARVVENLTVRLAHSSLAAISVDLDQNYKDTPAVVFGPRNVNAPDWRNQPASPAPFDFKLTFDTPWVYNGRDDLLWEVRADKVTPAPTALANYPFDFQPASGSFRTTLRGTSVGTGCTATGQTRSMVLATLMHNTSARFELQASFNFGPANAPAVLFLDVQDANLTVPGLCAAVRATPLVLLPLGAGSPTGAVASSWLRTLPYIPSLVGANLWLQAAALDTGRTGIRLALSQGKRQTLPATPAVPNVGRVYTYTTEGCTLTQEPQPGGVIAQFEYR
jgi:hypothetical protein